MANEASARTGDLTPKTANGQALFLNALTAAGQPVTRCNATAAAPSGSLPSWLRMSAIACAHGLRAAKDAPRTAPVQTGGMMVTVRRPGQYLQ